MKSPAFITSFRCFGCNRTYNDKKEFRTLGTDGKIWVGICWDCAKRHGAIFHQNKTDERVHQRAYLDWGISYLDIDHWINGQGVIRDISKGGIRFFTDTALEKGSLIDLEVRTNSNMLVMKEKAKIIRSSPIEEGYEIGSMFVVETPGGVGKGDRNRRKYIRYNVAFMIEFRINLMDKPSLGKVIDISQGGAKFLTTREMKVGQNLYLVVDTRKLLSSRNADGKYIKGNPGQLRHIAKIVGVIKRDTYFEIRTAFLNPSAFQKDKETEKGKR